MKNLKQLGIICFLFIGGSLMAQNGSTMVGGAEMYPSKNIVENASKSEVHTTLVAAVKAADLVATLQSEGPFTVFAPTNAAFEKLPAGTVESLLQPENKEKLQAVLTYHVIAGDYSASEVVAAIKKGDGKASFETVNGAMLYAMMEDGKVKLQDAQGNVATVTTADVNQSNGVIHVIDSVLLPGN
ncbi:putative surface protein with fasciclin (FAS1) repeats [Salegentibacter sp. 24]|jgi:uncharacterized surface protein with fasciclin (FAS1) repeats|uniref:fasciclin domain-containing protein n=1 Tax=Salegentibacter sp. 24 TaxID=2183986 RepID=UPI00105DE3E8|nr:fasciclin domain-containing protein [Salegentibacter sp. 24]TDN86427.1 putative surface protein with fasciclin (FAS1) repeats [Salegentibacter sp. 24]